MAYDKDTYFVERVEPARPDRLSETHISTADHDGRIVLYDARPGEAEAIVAALNGTDATAQCRAKGFSGFNVTGTVTVCRVEAASADAACDIVHDALSLSPRSGMAHAFISEVNGLEAEEDNT